MNEGACVGEYEQAFVGASVCECVRACMSVREGVQACASACVEAYEHIIGTSERIISPRECVRAHY